MGELKEENEKKIPVFTVFKNNSILKNIFLDAPPTRYKAQEVKEEEEQIVVIGRHPDCSITLDHPSISRFHLRLISKPSTLHLSLVDLSSVHGTWVSGKKVESGVQVTLNEGDTLRLGGSSRLYVLHWVPVSRAYNMDDPFVPPMDVLMPLKESEELTNQDENFCSSIETSEVQSLCVNSEDMDLSISKKDVKVSPSAPPMLDFDESSFENDEEAETGNLIREEHEQNEVSGFYFGQPLVDKAENQHSDKEDENSSTAIILCSSYTKDLLGEEHKENGIFGFSSRTPLVELAVAKFESEQSHEENDEKSQALDGLSTGISYSNSPGGSHNKTLREDNDISAISFGQLLSESVADIENQQIEDEYDNSQTFAKVVSGIADADSPTNYNEKPLTEEHEEIEIPGFLFRQLLQGSFEGFENQQSDEVCENSQALASFSVIAEVNSPSVDNNNCSVRDEDKISSYPSIDHTKNPSRKENEEVENSNYSSGQLLKESVAVTEKQEMDKENENPQAFDTDICSIGNAYSPSHNHYSRNLLEFFGSSCSDEDVEITCASKLDHEREMTTSGCNTPCSDGILESKDHLNEQDCNLEYPSSSRFHTRQTLKNALNSSEQEINWSQSLEHSLSDVDSCTVGERSEVFDNKSLLEEDNEHKEVPGITFGALEMDWMNLSVCRENIPTENCFERLEEVNNTVGERSEVFDNKSLLEEDNEHKEVPGITFGALEMDWMNLSVCRENIPTENCFERLEEVNNTAQIFATDVSEPTDTDAITPLRSEQQSDPPSIDIQTGKLEGSCTGFTTDYVDSKSVPKKLISSIEVLGLQEVYTEEIFTPDKENYTPNTVQRRSIRKSGRVDDIKISEPLGLSSSSKNSVIWDFVQNEELIFSSDKENHTPKVFQECQAVQTASKKIARLKETATKNRINRVPFQSLLSDSSSKSCNSDTARSSNSGGNAQPIEKKSVAAGANKRWIMVVDTNCLLNKASRKALQLLQGVKGTQLIIPGVVIRELDCMMKQRGYMFTKTTEVSSALQWIDDCMINTNWWISMEEGRHLAPTPPASPRSTSENGFFSFSSIPFFAFPSFLEVVSPTAGDHILECALLYRMKSDENLVILSDDVSLKIKAMAEGMICETAEEFRESLVNPFSHRFLWAQSSPRGLTWSCVDDIVLREKYYRGPLKKPSKSGESLKGLKLILLHNSNFSGLIPNSLEMNRLYSQ